MANINEVVDVRADSVAGTLPSLTLRSVFDGLLATYGHQRWWPGDTDFEIMVGAILTQNTAWANVEKAITNLKLANMLDAEKIVAADDKYLAGLLKPSGYFNIKSKRLKALCQWLIDQGGEKELAARETTRLRDELLAVHGVGPETADDILLYVFARPVFIIDAYTRRIFQRLGLIDGDEPYEELRFLFERELGQDVDLYNQYHALIVVHGKDSCRKNPLCGSCCLAAGCYQSKQ